MCCVLCVLVGPHAQVPAAYFSVVEEDEEGDEHDPFADGAPLGKDQVSQSHVIRSARVWCGAHIYTCVRT